MRPLRSAALIGAAIFYFALPADAGPSFRCDGKLNLSEQMICKDATLAALDKRMAYYFHITAERMPSERRKSFDRTQLLWLRWRDSCGADAACLRRRYEQRIIDIVPADKLPAGFGGYSGKPAATEDGPVKRIRNGRLETIHPDGRIDWITIGGGSSGTDYPDGTSQVAMPSMVGFASFPSLPGEYSGWGAALETSLLELVDTHLTPDEAQGYRQLIGDREYSLRIFDHIGVIKHLSGE